MRGKGGGGPNLRGREIAGGKMLPTRLGRQAEKIHGVEERLGNDERQKRPEKKKKRIEPPRTNS